MRLIDADTANVDDIPCYYGSNCYVEDVEEWLKDQPTIDAVPVMHGRWVGEVIMENGHAMQECNVCHKLRIVDTYCPNCGAKMDGGNDAED